MLALVLRADTVFLLEITKYCECLDVLSLRKACRDSLATLSTCNLLWLQLLRSRFPSLVKKAVSDGQATDGPSCSDFVAFELLRQMLQIESKWMQQHRILGSFFEKSSCVSSRSRLMAMIVSGPSGYCKLVPLSVPGVFVSTLIPQREHFLSLPFENEQTVTLSCPSLHSFCSDDSCYNVSVLPPSSHDPVSTVCHLRVHTLCPDTSTLAAVVYLYLHQRVSSPFVGISSRCLLVNPGAGNLEILLDIIGPHGHAVAIFVDGDSYARGLAVARSYPNLSVLPNLSDIRTVQRCRKRLRYAPCAFVVLDGLTQTTLDACMSVLRLALLRDLLVSHSSFTFLLHNELLPTFQDSLDRLPAGTAAGLKVCENTPLKPFFNSHSMLRARLSPVA
eukprot:GILJ01009449.1.p1 GENE.GILJ01009449.1~~GILJ01009449.1.p1  ORF type:complete len:390 (-),score=27.56 GILJ01009449.1:440-1609(-)